MSEESFHRERLNLPNREEQFKVQNAKKKQLAKDMAQTFGTSAGRRVLTHLAEITGYKKGKIGGNPQLGMDILQGTFYNCAREQIFLELIEFIPANVLRDCEFGVGDDLFE